MAQNRQETVKRRRGPGRPFKKGNNANPGGRPKSGLSFVSKVREVMAQVADEATGKTHLELLAEKYVELGEAGNVMALENLMARLHGKPEQGVKLTGDDNRPLHVRHSIRDVAAGEIEEPAPALPAGDDSERNEA